MDRLFLDLLSIGLCIDELVKRMNENDIEDKDTARIRAAARQKQFNDMESRLQRMDANL